MANRPTANIIVDWPIRSQNRVGLLVSVRDAQEARLCLRHGVDILDLKEPTAGALGLVSDAVIYQVQHLARQVVAEDRPKLSFALGELVDWNSQRYPRLLDRFSCDQIADMSFVKIGLAGAQQLDDWQTVWCELFADMPESIQPVVVGYLDRLPEAVRGRTAEVDVRCPDIEQLIEFAKDRPQVTTILLDTCDKDNNLFASVDDKRLQKIIATADQAGLDCVVAGSVEIDSMPRVIKAGATLVGVRGAVCDGDRSGELCEQKLVEFKQLIAVSVGDSIPQ